MMVQRLLRSGVLFAAMLLCLVSLPGCSGDKAESKPRAEKRDFTRIRELRERLFRLDESLARLKQEAQAQRDRIEAVQGDIAAVQKSLTDLGLPLAKSDLEQAGEPSAAAGKDRPKDAQVRRNGESRTLNFFIAVTFLAIAVVLIYHFWKRPAESVGVEGMDEPFERARASDQPASAPGAEPAAPDQSDPKPPAAG
jgi:hypothetical protein